MNEKELKNQILASISSFAGGNLTERALDFFRVLGYATDRQSPFPKKTYKFFKDSFLEGNTGFKEDKALVKDWKYVNLLFQLTKNEIAVAIPSPLVGEGQGEGKTRVDRTIIETYLFFVIELMKAISKNILSMTLNLERRRNLITKLMRANIIAPFCKIYFSPH